MAVDLRVYLPRVEPEHRAPAASRPCIGHFQRPDRTRVLGVVALGQLRVAHLHPDAAAIGLPGMERAGGLQIQGLIDRAIPIDHQVRRQSPFDQHVVALA